MNIVIRTGWLRLLPALALAAALATPAEAQLWSAEQARAEWKQMALGALVGVAAHEAGHLALAEILDRDAEFDGVTIVYPEDDLSDRDRARLASAGYQVQWALSETLLRRHEGGVPMTGFNAGVIASHVAITAAYMSVLYDHEDGDLTGISEATGWSRGVVAAWLLLPAALDGWRLVGRDVPDWVPTVSLMSKGLGITAIWTF